jgi:hypothetical protein
VAQARQHRQLLPRAEGPPSRSNCATATWISEGELFGLPRGAEHRPKADEEAHILLIEPRGTLNTGDARGDRTEPEA